MTQFTDLPLPDWGVPDFWCTPGGGSIMRRTGEHLRKELFESLDDSFVDVVSDSKQRDTYTSQMLLEGMLGLNNMAKARVRFDPVLFAPLHNNACTNPISDADLTAEVQRNLANIPYPSNIEKACRLAEKFLGVGPAGHLADLSQSEVLASRGGQAAIGGVVLVLKHFAQLLMYSFASGVPYSLHDEPSPDEIYELYSWEGWYRRVAMSTNVSALKNARVLRAIADMLATPGPRVTLIVGHDGNLNGLGEMLNLSWDAPPYGNFSSTPPGSAIHFEADDETGNNITVNLRYPVFIDKSGVTDTSGALLSVPLAASMSRTDFERWVQEGLAQHLGAEDCYAQPYAPLGVSQYEHAAAERRTDLRGVTAFFACTTVAAVLLSAYLGLQLLRERRRLVKRGQRNETELAMLDS